MLSWSEVNFIVRRGFGFVDLLKQHIQGALLEYADGKIIAGRGSANPIPFAHTVKYDASEGSFSISSSSAGGDISPAFERAEILKSVLGNRVMIISSYLNNSKILEIEKYCKENGIEPLLKLHETRAAHAEFVQELANKCPSIFLKELSAGDSDSVIFTPLGAVEAARENIEFVLPQVPPLKYSVEESGETKSNSATPA